MCLINILPGICEHEIATQPIHVQDFLPEVRILQDGHVVVSNTEPTFNICEALFVVGRYLLIQLSLETNLSSCWIYMCVISIRYIPFLR